MTSYLPNEIFSCNHHHNTSHRRLSKRFYRPWCGLIHDLLMLCIQLVLLYTQGKRIRWVKCHSASRLQSWTRTFFSRFKILAFFCYWAQTCSFGTCSWIPKPRGYSLKAFPATGQTRNVIRKLLKLFQGFQIQMNSKINNENEMIQIFIVSSLKGSTKSFNLTSCLAEAFR